MPENLTAVTQSRVSGRSGVGVVAEKLDIDEFIEFDRYNVAFIRDSRGHVHVANLNSNQTKRVESNVGRLDNSVRVHAYDSDFMLLEIESTYNYLIHINDPLSIHHCHNQGWSSGDELTTKIERNIFRLRDQQIVFRRNQFMSINTTKDASQRNGPPDVDMRDADEVQFDELVTDIVTSDEYPHINSKEEARKHLEGETAY